MAGVTGSSPYHPTLCSSCDAEIWFAVTVAGQKLMPLNAKTDPGGNVAAYQHTSGKWLARVLGKGQKPAPHEKLFCPHFATCPKAAEHRRQIRGAQAAINRHRRGKHAARTEPEAAPAAQPSLF